MSKVKETRLWSWLKAGGKEFKDSLHMSRVENSCSAGMADVEGVLRSAQFWLELKCEARPSHPSTKIKPRFQPSQAPWHRRRRRAGARTFVLLQVGQGHEARRYLVPGELIPSMAKGWTEARWEEMAAIPPTALAAEFLYAAAYSDII